jgi:hypothetical protein
VLSMLTEAVLHCRTTTSQQGKFWLLSALPIANALLQHMCTCWHLHSLMRGGGRSRFAWCFRLHAE